MKIIFAMILMLGLESCTLNPSKGNTSSAMQYPNLDRADIVNKWGYPAEILVKKSDVKLGNYIVTWVYYIQDSNGVVSPVFYNFRQGKPLSTNSFVVLKNHYRLLNTDTPDDLKLILSKREEIKKTWTIWPE
jgi:hypothetical protein